MLQLYHYFNEESKKLYDSINKLNIPYKAVCLFDDGFLPDDIDSPFAYYTYKNTENETYENQTPKAKPLYFNQLKVPKYWNIESDANCGMVYDKSKLKAKIIYANPVFKRRISGVAWLDDSGNVLYYDHYDKHGFNFAKTIVDKSENPITKLWLSKKDKSVIIEENFITGSIYLKRNGIQTIFDNLTEFTIYYLIERKYNLDCIIFNSLFYPYYVSEKLSGDFNINGTDFLFWQENINDEIPGNMIAVSEGKANRLCHAVIQNFRAYQKILEKYGKQDWFSYLGYLLPEIKNKLNVKKILITTNSDEIEHLKEIVEYLDEFEFNICSYTTMSDKLQAYDKYNNVHLYPTSSPDDIREFRKKCQFYLNINHYNEIDNSLYEAILNKQLVLSFENTVHNKDLVLDNLIYKPKKWKDLCENIKNLSQNKKMISNYIDKQNKLINKDTFDNYKSVFNAIID